jgi:hypothetical protein
MLAAGMATIILLWGIGRATGAYNALYAANQSAAYAASTAARSHGSGEVDGPQIRFQCNTTNDPTDCVGGETFAAADQVMSAALGPGASGTFGLRYTTNPNAAGTNVWLVDERERRLGYGLVQAYEVSLAPSLARRLASRVGCIPNAGEDEGYFDLTPSPGPLGDELLVCWRVQEFGTAYPLQFQSGIISRARARLALYPGCASASWCPTVDMVATSAATQSQPNPFDSYADYYDYGS